MLQLQAVCEAHCWQFCVIGGLAVEQGGEPRSTKDVDMTLLSGFGDEGNCIKVLLNR